MMHSYTSKSCVKELELTIEERLFNMGNGVSAPKKEQKQYTPIDKYKPTGKFVYNPDILEKIDKRIN